MEYLIIILVVSMIYLIIPSKRELLSDQWDGSDIDGGDYIGTKPPKGVKKKTRKRTKVLPKKVKKKKVLDTSPVISVESFMDNEIIPKHKITKMDGGSF